MKRSFAASKASSLIPLNTGLSQRSTRLAKPPIAIHIRNGHWPDDVAQSPRSNMPSDPFEALKLEVHDKLEQALNWLKTAPKVPTETDANMARNMQAALLQLNKRADAMHKLEKQPHLDAGRAVDTKFDFRKVVATVADRLKDVFTAFMRAEGQVSVPRRKRGSRKRSARPKRRERLLRKSEKGCKTWIPLLPYRRAAAAS